MKYRKKPEEIDVIQFTGENSHEIAIFAEKTVSSFFGSDTLTISTIGGHMTLFKNNWLIKKSNGRLDFCDADKFDRIYERIDDNKSLTRQELNELNASQEDTGSPPRWY